MTKRINADFDPISWDVNDRLMYQGEPFTGEVVETLGDKILSQQSYVNGIPHGPDREWWPNGTLESEGQMRDGRPYGIYRRWHENGQLAGEKHFGDDGALHTVLEWDEDGNPIELRTRRRRNS
ncbi:toxin-antitoxin system YwqK family antitoxin [Nocardia terpenica]|uniref:Toxin-antitoxin system YwqK family antitoxin n=1 Tax=Nocardia terpenica TaxID=455432 RepID=A0A0U1Z2F7_9NOCA|nr:hypothetical protein [Nocardia terpenica]AJO72787.1 hypothetical protein [Nocardia terpenica]KZM75405.1 hypothetical protein AWN90_18645 [Nocardia terpenica]NQE85868.1 hypothetical protein [Nocardia terpenica]BBE00889.1 hypothetical protein [Nocardia terpenica]